mmetsp:Transcript_37895/g.83429  ORF Transcript_37895/g.83429 Transcript_37895/m.83429 type:complete len:334 (-) Transcript_37895:353-1354(-)
MRPPTERSAAPRIAICSCIGCALTARSGSHREKTSGCLRPVPSPEHGTSHTIRSNPPSGKHCPRWLVTSTLDTRGPSAAQRLASVQHRSAVASFATTTPRWLQSPPPSPSPSPLPTRSNLSSARSAPCDGAAPTAPAAASALAARRRCCRRSLAPLPPLLPLSTLPHWLPPFPHWLLPLPHWLPPLPPSRAACRFCSAQIMSMACVVLEPGAAHMSSRRQPPLCPSSATGSIDASSWRIIWPESFPSISQERSCACGLLGGALRSAHLSSRSCQPSATWMRRAPAQRATRRSPVRRNSALTSAVKRNVTGRGAWNLSYMACHSWASLTMPRSW